MQLFLCGRSTTVSGNKSKCKVGTAAFSHLVISEVAVSFSKRCKIVHDTETGVTQRDGNTSLLIIFMAQWGTPIFSWVRMLSVTGIGFWSPNIATLMFLILSVFET